MITPKSSFADSLRVHSQLCLAKADALLLESKLFGSASISSFRKDNRDNSLMSKDYGLNQN